MKRYCLQWQLLQRALYPSHRGRNDIGTWRWIPAPKRLLGNAFVYLSRRTVVGRQCAVHMSGLASIEQASTPHSAQRLPPDSVGAMPMLKIAAQAPQVEWVRLEGLTPPWRQHLRQEVPEELSMKHPPWLKRVGPSFLGWSLLKGISTKISGAVN